MNLKLRKLRVKGFEKVSEEERRRKHGKKAGIIAIICFPLSGKELVEYQFIHEFIYVLVKDSTWER